MLEQTDPQADLGRRRDLGLSHRRGSFRGSLLGWLPVALTLLIGGAASWSIITLHRNADRAEQAQITVAEIQRNAQNADNIFYGSAPSKMGRLLAGPPPPGGLSVPGLQADNLARLAALRSSTGDGREIDVVSRDLIALNRALKPASFRGGLDAVRIRGRRIASRLDHSLDQLARKIRVAGRHASTFSQAGTWLVTLLAALIVSVLLRSLERRRRHEAAQHADALHALALRDPLTGLGNRRQLEQDIELAVHQATQREPVRLSFFDLDGFKNYNDAFGHHEGDLLLRRLAFALRDAAAPCGNAYRLGGDEFCVLTKSSDEDSELDERLRTSLSSRGEGFSITASGGSVLLPNETQDPEKAMQWADARMYADKNTGRLSAGDQTRNVALNMLAAHESGLFQHSSRVAELASEVGKRMGMGPEALDELVRAAELHDVGKVAIPFSILEKPAALNDEEWQMIRRHPMVGANILSSAPALAGASSIVRSAHERYDGDGYPDGLSAEEIPLASRIIFACDAFDAMTSERAYRKARSEHEALEEIIRCAGTQFDPAVAAALRQSYEATHRVSALSRVAGAPRRRAAKGLASAPGVALG
jgi:diguanylate cyclase (GGDEF)-like protein